MRDTLLEQKSTTSCDVLGNAVSQTDALGNATFETYDALGRMVTTKDANGNVTSSVYDGFGNLVETIQPDPAGGSNTPETFYVYDAGNQLVEEVSPAGPASSPNSIEHFTGYQYDDLGREITVSQLSGTISSSTTTDDYGVSHTIYSGTTELTTSYGYDADGNQVTTTDPLSQVTTNVYDHLNRLVEVIQPSPDGVAADPTTAYTYDSDGNELTETDPDGNVTTYSYNSLNRLTSASETIALYLSGDTPVTATATTSYQYDANGNLIQKTDADGQVTLYAYDALNRETGEKWYPNQTDATDAMGATDTVTFNYNFDGELRTASDDFSSYAYVYDLAGRQLSSDNDGTSGVPDVVLSSSYDPNGNRTSLSATIGGTADFVNTYSYDDLNRETQVKQGDSTVSGHDAVDSKLVNFTYNADGQFASIDRFNDLTGSSGDRVSTSTYGYDAYGRTTSLSSTKLNTSTTYADYAWTYDSDSEVTSSTNTANIDGTGTYDDENVATYSYDHDGQLTGATQQSGQTANASNSLSNSYDANGNATNINGGGATTVGAGNTLLFDGTYDDTYDKNGNLTEQADATDEVFYTYDNRNRLTSVVDKVYESGSWVETQEVDYVYDLFNNLIGRTAKTYESDGTTVATSTTQGYVYDGTSAVFAFDVDGNLTDRYLNGPATDQVLADEQFSLSGTDQLPSSVGNTLWALGDNQKSVRDVVNDSGTLDEHIAYSPFGQQTAQSSNSGSVTFTFGYTGTYTDSVTADQLHGLRWYDPSSQRWLTQDPSGLGPDSNPFCYCDDAPCDATDQNGLYPAVTNSLYPDGYSPSSGAWAAVMGSGISGAPTVDQVNEMYLWDTTNTPAWGGNPNGSGFSGYGVTSFTTPGSTAPSEGSSLTKGVPANLLNVAEVGLVGNVIDNGWSVLERYASELITPSVKVSFALPTIFVGGAAVDIEGDVGASVQYIPQSMTATKTCGKIKVKFDVSMEADVGVGKTIAPLVKPSGYDTKAMSKDTKRWWDDAIADHKKQWNKVKA